tara:strand:- start:2020 stop:2148 length:129 start_codon:yes stop_codon:yes gene_type:complete
MNQENLPSLESSQDVIMLEGLFFVRPSAIKNNSEIAQETLKT